VIAKSEANHARRAVKAGAAGVFLAIANAQDGILSQADYSKFSAPFDRKVLDSASGAPLNTLHLHGDKVYLDLFWKDWPGAINYSNFGTSVTLDEARRRYSGLLMSGIDERNYRNLSEAQIKQQIQAAREAAGKRFLLAPGCSVPNETTDAEMMRLVRAVGA
jgi:uroporphyrinogen decarboxylase